MAGAVNGLHGHSVVLRQCLLETLAAKDGAVLHVLCQHACAPAYDLLPDVIGHAAFAGEDLQAAALTTAAKGPVRIEDHVPVLCSHKLCAGKELAVQDQTAAHAGAGEKADDVFIALRCAELVFAQHAKVHIVAHKEGDAELFLDGPGDVVVAPGKIRREKHDAVVLVDDAGGAGGDGIELFPVNTGLTDHILHHADDDLFHIACAVALALGALFQPVDDLILLVEDGAEHLGAADVQTNVVAFRHVYILLYGVFVRLHAVSHCSVMALHRRRGLSLSQRGSRNHENKIFSFCRRLRCSDDGGTASSAFGGATAGAGSAGFGGAAVTGGTAGAGAGFGADGMPTL